MSVILWNTVYENAQRAARDPRFTPLADIAETHAGYVIDLELPGFAASEVEVVVQDGILRVAGERKPVQQVVAGESTDGQDPVQQAETAAEGRRIHRAERVFGHFERRFRLPKDADADAVSASSSNGVLTLEIARLAEAAPRSIEVKVA